MVDFLLSLGWEALDAGETNIKKKIRSTDTVVNNRVQLCGVGGQPKTETERAPVFKNLLLDFLLKQFLVHFLVHS